MYPLDGTPALVQVINRVSYAEKTDEIIVATSDQSPDDIIAWVATQNDTELFRGSESDVLGRMFNAASELKADYIVRITSDCPLIPPEVIDSLVEKLHKGRFDHVGTIAGDSSLTISNGLGAEAFTFDSFEIVNDQSHDRYQREHVTPYYRENPDEFDTSVLHPHEVEGIEEDLLNKDMRLTMDVSEDYQLLKTVYENVEYDHILDLEKAIEYIEDNELNGINSQVEQKSVKK